MVFQAFLVALVAFFAYSSNKFLGDAMVNRPLVTATLTGISRQVSLWPGHWS